MNKIQKNAQETELKVFLDDRKSSWMQHFYFKSSNYVLRIEDKNFKIYKIIDLDKNNLDDEFFNLYYDEIKQIEMYFTKEEKIEITGIKRNIFFINLKIEKNKQEIYNFKIEGIENSKKLFNLLKDKKINIQNEDRLNELLINKTYDDLYYYLNHKL